MKHKRRIKKPSRTLADIRRIPKWARKKVGFTCEEVEFNYELITHFFSKDSDTKQTRPLVFTPGIGRFAVTPWIED
jgi:hypothetical protein